MIRRLGLEDRTAFRALRQAALEAHPESYATSGQDWKNASDDKIDALLQGSVDGMLPIYGCFAPDLIGMVGLRLETDPTTRHKAMVWGLFVQPTWQGQGIGRSLMEYAIGDAQNLPGLTLLVLVVTTDNTPALQLFEASGFQSYGVEPQARKVGDVYYDQVFQCRFLQEALTVPHDSLEQSAVG